MPELAADTAGTLVAQPLGFQNRIVGRRSYGSSASDVKPWIVFLTFRNKAVIHNIMDCIKKAKTLEYLNWYRIGSGKTVTRKATLSINIDKFRSTKQIAKIIDDGYREEEPIKEVKKIEDSEIVKKQKAKIRAILGLPKR